MNPKINESVMISENISGMLNIMCHTASGPPPENYLKVKWKKVIGPEAKGRPGA